MIFLSQLQSGEIKHGFLYGIVPRYYGKTQRGDMKNPRDACMTEV